MLTSEVSRAEIERSSKGGSSASNLSAFAAPKPRPGRVNSKADIAAGASFREGGRRASAKGGLPAGLDSGSGKNSPHAFPAPRRSSEFGVSTVGEVSAPRHSSFVRVVPLPEDLYEERPPGDGDGAAGSTPPSRRASAGVSPSGSTLPTAAALESPGLSPSLSPGLSPGLSHGLSPGLSPGMAHDPHSPAMETFRGAGEAVIVMNATHHTHAKEAAAHPPPPVRPAKPFGGGESLGGSASYAGGSLVLGSRKRRPPHWFVTWLDDHLPESMKRPLHPNGRFMAYWDWVIIWLLAFTATVTPFEVSFLGSGLDDPTNRRVVLFAVNRFVDACFLFDMCCQVNTQYQNLTKGTSTYVSNRGKIAMRYLQGWFAIDIISIMPFDVIGNEAPGDASAVDRLKILRVIRLLRLLKLLRLFRLQRIITSLQDRYSINTNWLTLVRFMLGILLLAHWFACAFHMVARFQTLDANQITWVDHYFGVQLSYNFSGHTSATYVDEYGLNPYDVYIAAVYYSMVTMCTIGYGDIVPVTTSERFYIIFEMLLGTATFAYVVGTVCGIITNLDKKNAEFAELMDNLNSFMDDLALPDSMRDEMRLYFRYRRRFLASINWRQLLDMMSPALRAEVADQQFGAWVRGLELFKRAPRALVLEIAQLLNSETYPKNEVLVSFGDEFSRLFIVERGLVGAKGKVLSAGKMLCEEVLTGIRISAFIARALTITDLFVVDGLDIQDVVSKYPVVEMELKRVAARHLSVAALLAFSKKWAEVTTRRLQRRGSALLSLASAESAGGGQAGFQSLLNRDEYVNAFVDGVLTITKARTGVSHPSRPDITAAIEELGFEGVGGDPLGSGLNMPLPLSGKDSGNGNGQGGRALVRGASATGRGGRRGSLQTDGWLTDRAKPSPSLAVSSLAVSSPLSLPLRAALPEAASLDGDGGAAVQARIDAAVAKAVAEMEARWAARLGSQLESHASVAAAAPGDVAGEGGGGDGESGGGGDGGGEPKGREGPERGES